MGVAAARVQPHSSTILEVWRTRLEHAQKAHQEAIENADREHQRCTQLGIDPKTDLRAQTADLTACFREIDYRNALTVFTDLTLGMRGRTAQRLMRHTPEDVGRTAHIQKRTRTRC